MNRIISWHAKIPLKTNNWTASQGNMFMTDRVADEAVEVRSMAQWLFPTPPKQFKALSFCHRNNTNSSSQAAEISKLEGKNKALARTHSTSLCPKINTFLLLNHMLSLIRFLRPKNNQRVTLQSKTHPVFWLNNCMPSLLNLKAVTGYL